VQAGAAEHGELTLLADDEAPAGAALDAQLVGVVGARERVEGGGGPERLVDGEPAAQAGPLASAAPKQPASEGEAEARALANPEVQRFREVFGGEVRKVRNLKE